MYCSFVIYIYTFHTFKAFFCGTRYLFLKLEIKKKSFVAKSRLQFDCLISQIVGFWTICEAAGIVLTRNDPTALALFHEYITETNGWYHSEVTVVRSSKRFVTWQVFPKKQAWFVVCWQRRFECNTIVLPKQTKFHHCLVWIKKKVQLKLEQTSEQKKKWTNHIKYRFDFCWHSNIYFSSFNMESSV